jgi:hypothetical protein
MGKSPMLAYSEPDRVDVFFIGHAHLAADSED